MRGPLLRHASRMPLVLRAEGGRPAHDPCLTRWGCVLPDLTRLASGASAASLPGHHIMTEGGRRKGRAAYTDTLRHPGLDPGPRATCSPCLTALGPGLRRGDGARGGSFRTPK